MFQVGDLVRYAKPIVSNDIPGLVVGLAPDNADLLEVQWLDWEPGTLADEDPEVLELVSSVSEDK